MGIVDRFLKLSGSPTPVNIYEGDRKLVTFQFDLAGRQSGRDAFAPRPILLPQSETERLLGDLLGERGGAIEWGTELMGFTQSAMGVDATVRKADGLEERITSSWLVSCEGAHSVVRKEAGISFTGKTYPLAFALADVEIEWHLNHEENHAWLHKDGAFAALPLPGAPNIWRLFIEVSLNADVLSDGVTLEAIQQLMATRTGYGDALIKNATWLSDFKINCRMVDRFRVGRVFVAGDAAHIHSPTGGQGITTGVLDAVNLAWKLGRVLRGAPDSLLDMYEEERLPKAKEVLAPQGWNILVTNVVTLSEQVNQSLLQERLISTLSSLFGLLALLLACVGLYGVMSYDMTRRTHEIGIRLALGAQSSDVLRMMLREGLGAG